MSYKILLLSAYDAMSHTIWRRRLAAMFPEHKWTQLALPPRHFNWRIRGNSLQWALNEQDALTQDYDLLIATSMVDLASLRGFVPSLSKIPTLLYFHENQFAYPVGNTQRSNNVEPQLVPLYSAYCADAVAFNSNYNRCTFLQGAKDLLEKLPDRLPEELLLRYQKSEVVPVPLKEVECLPDTRQPKEILDVIWNHRWEYDKGPKLLLLLTEQILQQRLPIRLHVVGQQFRSSPEEFQKIHGLLQQHASALAIDPGNFGFIEDREQYTKLLRRCDVVLSTALHDFQGLSLQEACALGCTPLAPNKLVYPEYLESQFLYNYDERNSDQENCQAVLAPLKAWQQLQDNNTALPKINLDEYSQGKLRPEYARLFDKLVNAREA